ncbi:MAG: MmcQ/YjbR family DNA-binding protein [Candidatus Cloacimonadales bacterium]|nr:MmcQ/YjbR family DNA-binding protein [Candidatus Cloacimonadales bacterium]
MNLKQLRKYFALKPGAYEDFPFDDVTMVIKVGNKMFALIGLDAEPLCINLKCDPMLAVELRQLYPAVIPGYHMNKTHWNTVILDGSIPEKIIKKMIDDSYDLVFKSLTKKVREKILGKLAPPQPSPKEME